MRSQTEPKNFNLDDQIKEEDEPSPDKDVKNFSTLKKKSKEYKEE